MSANDHVSTMVRKSFMANVVLLLIVDLFCNESVGLDVFIYWAFVPGNLSTRQTILSILYSRQHLFFTTHFSKATYSTILSYRNFNMVLLYFLLWQVLSVGCLSRDTSTATEIVLFPFPEGSPM